MSKAATQKRQNIDLSDKWYFIVVNEGQNYCRMLQGGHSALLSTVLSNNWYKNNLWPF